MSVLILDGHLKSALSAVRSLGKKGIHTVVGAERSSAMALHSKYTKTSFVYESPEHKKTLFIETITKEAQKILNQTGEKPVVFCFSDATLLTLARSYDTLQEILVLPIPTLESLEIASDKDKTYMVAQMLSIPTIPSFRESEFDRVTYPAVIKNRHSIVWNNERGSSGTAQFVFSREELETTYKRIVEATMEAPLVQACIVGDEYGIEMACKKGEVLALFAHKRIRSLSPRGGAAVVKETAQESEEVTMMKAYAVALVKELEWEGPIMVEFKQDGENGTIVLMEINGRFWGSLPLAIHAGVDFPWITYNQARGKMNDIVSRSFRKMRTRHFLGDVKWVWRVFFASDRMRPYLYPSRLRAFWDFKTEIFRSKGDIFDIHDLRPSLFEYIDILRK